MKDLIEALIILSKYAPETNWPTICCHDVLIVLGVPEGIDTEDAKRLEELGFNYSDEFGTWSSNRFGSA